MGVKEFHVVISFVNLLRNKQKVSLAYFDLLLKIACAPDRTISVQAR